MPGTVEQTGSASARWLQDYADKYPKFHVVVAFKSTKAEFGLSQVAEYGQIGYTVLEESRHSDGVVMGMPWDKWELLKAQERELAQLPSASLTDSRTGEAFTNPTDAQRQKPMSRRQMVEEFGTVVETEAAPEE